MSEEELLKAFIVVSSENEKLQQRIEKAVEYIEKHNLDFKRGTTTRLEAFTMQERYLLNILNGRSDE